MKRLLGTLSLAAFAALAAPAAAQEAAPVLQEDPRAAKFAEVERGLFVAFETGWLGFLDTPVADPATFGYAGTSGGASGGLLVGLQVGVELGPRIAVSLFLQGGSETASVDYGAFSVFSAGGDVRVSMLSLADRNGSPRLLGYLHARAGALRSYPEGLFADQDVLVAGGPGVEYFTRLRHFSLGLAVDYVQVLDSGTSGYAIYPTVRYTF